jgi:hypothetical protein
VALIKPIVQQLESVYGHVALYTWPTVTEADTCDPVQAPGYADRSVHAFGTWGGATLTIQVSNERAGITAYPSYQIGATPPEVANAAGPPANFVSAHDPQGTALTMTADKIEEVSELSAWLVPTFTVLGTSRSVTVALCMRRPI